MQASSRSSAKTKAPNWVGPSHISVFIRNLKLIHLDEREDWPDVNLRVFSNSTQQNQRQRIKCVEWALYYLFTIWDPETANNKLRPFFPPLEPLQSLNLRAALFRALSELKKNGELGRETIVRKSMLDECKGDKFEEVLAVFSTNVVRKLLSKKRALVDNPATALSTASQLTSAKQDSLLPLVLAHRVSLGSMLEDKVRLQGYYDDFRQHLDSKDAELTSRPNLNPQLSAETGQESDSICRAVKGAWFGPEEWADAILQGGIQHATDNLFELPFDETWSRISKGDVESLGYDTAPDLLVDLDRRLKQQKGRLRKWQDFRADLKKRSQPEAPGKNAKASSSLLFRDHQNLAVTTTSRSPSSSAEPDGQVAEYKCLVSAMNASLSDLKGDSARNQANTQSSRRIAVKEEPEPPRLTDGPDIPISRGSSSHSFSNPGSPGSHLERDEQRIPSEEELSQNTIDLVDTNITNTRFEMSRPDSPDQSERAERLDPVKENAELGYKDRKLDKAGVGTLLERTRQSMTLLPPSTGPRQSINPKSIRQSQGFPINQFETPQKPVPVSGPKSGATTPKEELYDADYASVFKSRPKIATSPVISPAVHMQSLDNIDNTVDFSLSELDMEGSPSIRTRVQEPR